MRYESTAPLPHPQIEQARWIWPDSLHWDLGNGYALFRKAFDLPIVPATAPLFITADQSYQLYINGSYICRGPGRGFQARWPYDDIDVAKWLIPGRNIIAIRAYNPGCSNYQYVSQGYAGLLVAAEWNGTVLVSDTSWRCRRQNGVRRDTVPTSLQLFQQENIDLRTEDPSWMTPAFDDAAWGHPSQIAVWNAMPWSRLQPRGMPRLDETEIQPGTVIGLAQGEALPGYRETRDLTAHHFATGFTHRSTTPSPVAETLAVAPSAAGHWRSLLIDLGKTHIGSVILEIDGADGGEIVETHHFETCSADATSITPDYKLDAHCRMAFSHRLTCRAGRNQHTFYHAFGFRYLILVIRDNARELKVNVSLRTAVYPLKSHGIFRSSDPALNQIWDACAWTQRVCSLDAYVDTPSREQAQWWGDARVQAWNTFHLDADPRLLLRGIRDIGAQTTPDGVTYGHAPTIAHHCILPDFTVIWLLTLWDYYWQTGSLEPFRAHQSQIQRALSYFRKWTCAETGLLRHDPRFWLFLDWTDLRKDGCPAVYSLWLLHALDQLTVLYRLIEDEPQANTCSQWAADLRTALLPLINEDGLMRDGYTPAGEIDPATSIHAQTLALLTQLASEHEAAMLERCLVPAVRGELKLAAPASAYWTTYVYTALATRGHAGDVIADIRRRWGAMADHGTTWETFDPPRAEFSFSHAWSAHPLFHLMQTIGGIRQSAPGWTEIEFSPVFVGDHADVTVPTPHGSIQSSWRRESATIRGELSLPDGITATVRLPDADPATVCGHHAYTVVATD